MSRRYAMFYGVRDLSEPDIVEAAEKAGWSVYKKLPVDLLLLKRVNGRVHIRLMDAKTAANKKGEARKRKDQQEQDAFCAQWDVPKPTTPEQALRALGEVTR